MKHLIHCLVHLKHDNPSYGDSGGGNGDRKCRRNKRKGRRRGDGGGERGCDALGIGHQEWK